MEKKSGPSQAALFGATVIMLLGAWLRFRGLGTESLWHDEAWSWMLVRGDFTGLLRTLFALDAHPPLYYLLLRLTTLVTGTSAVGLRALSALLGVAALPLMFRFARRFGGDACGLIALLLLALSPFHVVFSQEARCYTLLFFLCLLSLDLLLDLKEAPRRRTRILFALCTAAIMLTHYLGSLFILAEAAWAAFHLRGNRDFFRAFRSACFTAFLIFLPWLSVFVVHVSRVHGNFWLPEPTPRIFMESMKELTTLPWGIPRHMADLLTLLVFGAATAGYLLLRKKASPANGAFAALFFLLPILFELLLSLSSPIYYTRTFIHVLAPLILLAAFGLFRLRTPLRETAVFLIAGCFLPGLIHLHGTEEKENWRDLSIFLQCRVGEGEAVLVQPWYLPANIEHYDGAVAPTPPLQVRTSRPGESLSVDRMHLPADVDRPFFPGAPRGLWLVARYGQRGAWPGILERDFEKRGTFFFRKVEVDWYQRRTEHP